MSGSMSGDWNRGLNQGLTGPVLDYADSLEGADREEVGDTPVVSVTLRRDDVQWTRTVAKLSAALAPLRAAE